MQLGDPKKDVNKMQSLQLPEPFKNVQTGNESERTATKVIHQSVSRWPGEAKKDSQNGEMDNSVTHIIDNDPSMDGNPPVKSAKRTQLKKG